MVSKYKCNDSCKNVKDKICKEILNASCDNVVLKIDWTHEAGLSN